MKSRVLKAVRNTLISMVVLLVLFVGAGAGYTWYVGQNEQEVAAAPPAVESSPVKRTIAPPTISEDAPASASVQSLTTPVAPGKNASASVKTLPGATCQIKVIYNEVPSSDTGLVDKVADDYGIVSWSWTVEASAPTGTWPVEVTCAKGDKSAFVRGNLEVKP